MDGIVFIYRHSGQYIPIAAVVVQQTEMAMTVEDGQWPFGCDCSAIHASDDSVSHSSRYDFQVKMHDYPLAEIDYYIMLYLYGKKSRCHRHLKLLAKLENILLSESAFVLLAHFVRVFHL